MNRQSFPKEIDAPELHNRGLYVFHGCDASTSRQLAQLLQEHDTLHEIEHICNEDYVLSENEQIFALTSSRFNQYISHAVGYLGSYGLRIFRFHECDDDDEVLFKNKIAEFVSEK